MKFCLCFECSNVNFSFRFKMDVINVRYYLCLIDFLILGYEVDVKYWCLVMLLSNFIYSYNDGSVMNCGLFNFDFVVCFLWIIMIFNYVFCSMV